MSDTNTTPAAAVPAEPLTDEQIERHTLLASQCPPDSQVLLVSSVRRLRAALASQASAPPVAAEPVPDPTNTLEWLASHCRAIGMTRKSDSGLLAHDIALFTMDLKDAATQSPPVPAQSPIPAGDPASPSGSTSLRSSDPYRDVRGAE